MKDYFIPFIVMVVLCWIAIIGLQLKSPAPQKTEFTQSQIRSICQEDIECWSRAEYLSK